MVSLLFEHDGLSYSLNPLLVEQMKLDDERLLRLIDTHHKKLNIFNAMREFEPNRRVDREKLHILAAMVTQIEFLQQRVWGFAEDKNYHLFWQMPHCTCDKTENERRWSILHQDYFAYPGPAYATDCLYHGNGDPVLPTPVTVPVSMTIIEDLDALVDQIGEDGVIKYLDRPHLHSITIEEVRALCDYHWRDYDAAMSLLRYQYGPLSIRYKANQRIPYSVMALCDEAIAEHPDGTCTYAKSRYFMPGTVVQEIKVEREASHSSDQLIEADIGFVDPGK